MHENTESKWQRFVRAMRLNSFYVSGLFLVSLLLCIPQIQNVLIQTVESKVVGPHSDDTRANNNPARGVEAKDAESKRSSADDAMDRWYAFGFLSFLFLAGTLSLGSIIGVIAPRWPARDENSAIGQESAPANSPSTRQTSGETDDEPTVQETGEPPARPSSYPLEFPKPRWVTHLLGALCLVTTFFIGPPYQLAVLVLAIVCFVPTVTRVIAKASGWLFYLSAKRFASQVKLACTGLTLVLISILVFVLVPIKHFDLPLHLLWQFVALLGMAGFWLLISCLPYKGKPSPAALLEGPGRVLGWFILVLIGGELCWLSANLMHDLGGSYRLYTIWGVMAVAALIVVLAGMIDRLLELTDWPARFFSVVALLFVFFAWWAPPQKLELLPATGKPADTKQQTPGLEWYDHLAARIESLDTGWPEGPKAPVVLVAASGGGSRAAVFTALTLESLEHQWLDKNANRTWADHILLISSVSGGSLASGYYAHGLSSGSRKSGQDPTAPGDWSDSRLEFRAPLRHVVRKDVAWAMRRSIRQELKKLLDIRGVKHKELSDDKLAELFESDDDPVILSMLEALKLYEPLKDWDWSPDTWVVQSGFVDDMWVDFMAPIIRGALTPSLNRGESLRDFWTREFKWGESQSGQGYVAAPTERLPNPSQTPKYEPKIHPIILFNTCDVRLGTRVVAGFPPLPRRVLRAASEAIPAGDRPDWVRRPRVLDESDSPVQVRLTDAIGMSANFPFGFNLLRVQDVATPTYATDAIRGSWPSDTQPQSVNLIDGGLVDNTGLDMIYDVFRGLWAMRYGSDEESVKAKRLLDLLAGRAVILLEIDSGSKPEAPSRITKLASLIMEPIYGLSNVSYANAELTKQMHLAKLTEWLDELKTPPDWLGTVEPTSPSIDGKNLAHWLRHIPFICNHLGDQNVMTAWALGPHDKGEVLARFLIESGLRKADLEEYRLRIEEQRAVKRRERAIAQTAEFQKQLELLTVESTEDAYNQVQRLANQISAGKDDLKMLAPTPQSAQAVQKFVTEVEQYAKQSSKPDSEQITKLKEAASKEFPLEELRKASQDRPALLKSAMSRPVDSRQFFDRRAVQKK